MCLEIVETGEERKKQARQFQITPERDLQNIHIHLNEKPNDGDPVHHVKIYFQGGREKREKKIEKEPKNKTKIATDGTSEQQRKWAKVETQNVTGNCWHSSKDEMAVTGARYVYAHVR